MLLDDPSRREIHELLNSTCRNKDVTVLHVTHHRDDARQLADQLWLMEDGAVREGNPDESSMSLRPNAGTTAGIARLHATCIEGALPAACSEYAPRLHDRGRLSVRTADTAGLKQHCFGAIARSDMIAGIPWSTHRRKGRGSLKLLETAKMRTALIEELETRRLLTVLLFQPATGSFANGSALPQAYGDRVNAAVQNNFKYPPPRARRRTLSPIMEPTEKLSSRGRPGSAIFPASFLPTASPLFEMLLAGDAGFKVSLSSFDLAGSPSHDWTIKSVQVADGNNNPLYSKTNVVIQGDATGTRHTPHRLHNLPAKSRIKIRFDASNLTGTAAIGLDNVQFSQVKIAPLPATISGNVFNDVNRDGIKAASGEPGLSGWRVYLDKNNDGIFQSTETSVLSDVNGNYSFSVAAGSYHVAEVLQAGWHARADGELRDYRCRRPEDHREKLR